MPETTALGAAMAAGKACGAWSLDPKDLTSVTFERFEPNVSQKGKIVLPYFLSLSHCHICHILSYFLSLSVFVTFVIFFQALILYHRNLFLVAQNLKIVSTY